MLKIVTSADQANESILKYEQALKHNPEMQLRLSYARAWYAYQDEAGSWSFAPLKFAAYQDIDASSFLQPDDADVGDGRRLEAQLRMFFRVVDPKGPLHAELTAALVSLLAKYGKTPSVKVRIHVNKEWRRPPTIETTPVEKHDAVVELILSVSKTLSRDQLQRLVTELSKIPLPEGCEISPHCIDCSKPPDCPRSHSNGGQHSILL